MVFAPTTQVAPAGSEVTMYEVMAAPPLSAGALKVTVMLLPLVTAETFEGAEGTPAGTADALADDCADVPMVVIAATLKV